MSKLPKVKTAPLQMGEYQPGKPGVIILDPSLSPNDRMDTLLHESLHAAADFLSEPAVEEIAVFLGRMLRRDGYVRKK